MSLIYPDLKGKMFLVTGASSRMGKAVSIMLAQQGANEGLFDTAPTENVENAISGLEGDGQSLVVKARVTNPDEVAVAIDKIVEKYGLNNLYVESVYPTMLAGFILAAHSSCASLEGQESKTYLLIASRL